MIRTAIKGVFAHKLRLVLTALAIVLGVAFVSGTFVFTDSINARFDSLFGDVYAGIDATVRPVTEGAEDGFDAALLEEIRTVDGVDRAEGAVAGFAQIIDSDGNPVGGQGPPTLGFSWIYEPALNTLTIADGNGRPPAAAGEVVIDAATAAGEEFELGDTLTVQTAGGTAPFTLVGIANFGSEDNLAGATLAVFELAEAQRLFDLQGRLTTVDLIAVDGVDAEELVGRLGAELPAGVEAVTGDQQTQEQLDQVTEGLGFLTVGLLAFAGVAVFVGGFIIQNTFRIIVGQRTRELALLRAVGATSRQVTSMVAIEALIVAIVASAVGVLAGIGVAEGVKSGMNALGLGMPDGPLTVEPRTIVVGMAVGIAVTLAASLLPARKAAAVPPVAAMRAESAVPTSLHRRAVTGGLLTAVGSGAILSALVTEIGSAAAVVGAGSLAVFLGISTLAPFFARPIATVVGAPLRGVVGRLARENTTRSPRRTASTASALMIGVALVAFVSIFAASVKASVSDTLEAAFPADLAFASTNFSVGVNDAMVEAIEDMDETRVVSAVHADRFEIGGEELNVAGVDPATIESVYAFGPSIDLEQLGNGLLVQADVLSERGWESGDVVDVTYPSGTVTTRIAGTFDDQTFAKYVVSDEVFEAGFGETDAIIVFARLVDGLIPVEGQDAAEAALASFPTVDINTASDQIAEAEAQVDQLVALFTGLLGLAVVIAVLGIANTLALSIVERTREIGLLRAVGLGRRGVRRMVRGESVIIAVFGALLGVVVGSALGWAVVGSLADDGLGSFSLPMAQLAAWIVAGAIAGVVAAIVPARKAARLDVLDAIAYQ